MGIRKFKDKTWMTTYDQNYDPNVKYCRWEEILEDTPTFERSIRFKQSEINLDEDSEDLNIYDGDRGFIIRRLKSDLLGVTYIYNGYIDKIEVWKGNIRYFSKLSPKFLIFEQQLENYVRTRQGTVNTLNEKLFFYKDIVHGNTCRCFDRNK
jgi:hypothetical protein